MNAFTPWNPRSWWEIGHNISNLDFLGWGQELRCSKNTLSPHMQEKRIWGILRFSRALLPHPIFSYWGPCLHYQDYSSSLVPPFNELVVKVWRAAFLCSDPPPFLVPTPIWRRAKGIVCVGSGWPSLSVLAATPSSSELCHLIPSSWFCCRNKGEVFLNVVQRCL